MTTAEAAQKLGYSRNHILHLINTGKLEARKYGRNYWIEPEEVARLQALPRPKPGWKKGQFQAHRQRKVTE